MKHPNFPAFEVIKYPYLVLPFKMNILFKGHPIATIYEREKRTWYLRYNGTCPLIDPYGGSTFTADTVVDALGIVQFIVNRVYRGQLTHA